MEFDQTFYQNYIDILTKSIKCVIVCFDESVIVDWHSLSSGLCPGVGVVWWCGFAVVLWFVESVESLRWLSVVSSLLRRTQPAKKF
jgi:hypothetical protein